MERVGPGVGADNTSVDVLTCPMGHKYEVIDLTFQAFTAGGGQTIAASVKVSGTPYSFWVIVGVPANTYALSRAVNHVLYEGDSLAMAEVGNGASWGYMVTYIDVDYSN